MKRVFYKILSLLFVSGLINFVALTTTSSDTQAQEKYALVIGISKYPRFTVSPKLKYADKDAINFSNFLQTPQGGGFSKNNIRLLVNEDATLEKINKEIVWIGKQISNKGLVYIFFAGHGMVDDTSQAYFMPYDSEDTSPSGLGIRADLLIENVKTRISRKHLVYFIDACHSGAALVPNGRTRGSNEFALKFNESWDKAYSDQKEKETDIGFLSASANELSYEDDELQQGLFTYYLIKGLRGEAKANASGVISAFALYKYLLDKVQGEAKRKFDANQTPMISPSFNPDFPVAIHPVAAIESVNPTLSTLKFFRSDEGFTPELGKRQYTDRFARNSTKYIHWELGLKHLAPDGILPFTVEAVLYRPDGSINPTTTNTKRVTSTSIAKDATESFHESGAGWKEAGNWIIGVHRVELFISGKMIASGSFEVFEPPVESLNPTLSSLKFFSSEVGTAPELGKRQYTDRFARNSTKYIHWELGLRHLAPDGILAFTIEAVHYRPDGSILPINSNMKALTNTSIAKDATESFHGSGVGWKDAGNWAIGVHRVELSINGKMITSGSFEVFEPPVESVNPTLSTLKFFRSDEGFTQELGKRQYTDRFARNSTKYIHWELGLKHLGPDGILPFTVEAVFYRPDGNINPNPTNMKRLTNTSIAKDATESFHQDGIGWKEAGNWITGVHRVELFISGKMIASGSFEVFEPPVESLNPTLSTLKFFESGKGFMTESGKRQYTDRFARTSTRYINWEMGLKHLAPDGILPFTVEAVFYRPDGSILPINSYTKALTNTSIAKDATESLHQDGTGWDQAGNWAIGVHRVELFINKKMIASGSFVVFEPPVESLNPTLSTLKFFSSEIGTAPELGKRQYTDQFLRNSARYIHWELGLKHLAPDGILAFTIEAVFYRPDGSVLPTRSNMKLVTYTSIAKDATESFHQDGIGWDEVGNWIIGVHRVELFINKKMIASGSFVVY